MAAWQKRTLAIVGILAASIALAVVLFDWNMLRGYIAQEVSQRSGRELSIAGNLDVELSLTPRVHAENVRLANADWGTEREMLDIEVLEFTVSLLPLWDGEIVVPEIALTRPKVVLEKDRAGQRNWILKKEQTGEERAPRIERLIVDRGTLVFRDPSIDTELHLDVTTDSAAADPNEASSFKAHGRFKGMAVNAKGKAGSVFRLNDERDPFPIAVEFGIGETRASLDGTITGLAQLSALDVGFTLAGNDLAGLYPITGIVLPPTPPYRIAGRLSHEEKSWNLERFSGRVGDSDLGGDFYVDTSGTRPSVRAQLVSEVLDLDDLAGFIGAPPQAGPGETASAEQKEKAARSSAGSRVLPDEEFNLARLGAMNAEVKFSGKSIRGREYPLDDLVTEIKLMDGVLSLEPLNFGVAGGHVISTIRLDANRNPLAAKADMRFQTLRLDRLFPGVKLTQASVGAIGGRARFSAEGNSFAKLMASADGEAGFSVAGGEISNLLLEILGLDGAEIIGFLLGGDKTVELRCAVADFKVNDGVMNADLFVVDTADTNITGEGSVNLADETLNLTLKPLPKDVSILSGRSPIHVTGSFKSPTVRPTAELYERGGGALLLGTLVNPLAVLIPLIETGPGKDSDCRDLIAYVGRAAKPGR
jgi:hypothetical protein